jgi:hypothetical protein
VSVVHTTRELFGHTPAVADATHVGVPPAAPPTQQTLPAAQLVGVQGGGVQSRTALLPPPWATHVSPVVVHCESSSQIWR